MKRYCFKIHKRLSFEKKIIILKLNIMKTTKELLTELLEDKIAVCEKIEEISYQPVKKWKSAYEDWTTLRSRTLRFTEKEQLQEVLQSEEKLKALSLLTETAIQDFQKRNDVHVYDMDVLAKEMILSILKGMFKPELTTDVVAYLY